jgi:hypothetical protein
MRGHANSTKPLNTLTGKEADVAVAGCPFRDECGTTPSGSPLAGLEGDVPMAVRDEGVCEGVQKKSGKTISDWVV